MKTIALTVGLLWLTGASLYVCAQQYITPDQAKSAVRTFELQAEMQFANVELHQDMEGPAWSHRAWYDLMADNVDVGPSWDVDAVTGEVVFAYHDNAIPDNDLEGSPGPLTQEQCRQIAEDFARAKYSNFDIMGFLMFEEEWNGTGWSFHWRQKLSSNAWAISGVQVAVNPVDGSIQTYSSARAEISTIRDPVLTSEQAVNAAKLATGITTTSWVKTPYTEADPDRIYWIVDMGGEDSQGHHLMYWACVDAQTGEIISKELARGTQNRKVNSVDEDTGQAMQACPAPAGSRLIWIRELAAKLPNASVKWVAGSCAVLTIGKASYRIQPDTQVIDSGKKQIKLSRKTHIIKGMLMVPEDLLYCLGR